MRQLIPDVVDPVDPAEVYADLPVASGRPAVRLNMISSVDGATALDGVSGGLGSLADKKVFAVLRSLADVVLVAAGTVRAEHYGPSTVPIAVVTRAAQPPYSVFLNGVTQTEGVDYEVHGRALSFDRPLAKEGRLGAVRWAGIFLGLFGTYRQNDSVDVQYEENGELRIATYLDIVHPGEGEPANPS